MARPGDSRLAGRAVVLTIVQARMGSKRFPGKVMVDLGGKPMVRHVLERAAAIGDRAVLAVPRSDLVVWPWPHLFRGEEEDVLTRMYDCAAAYNRTTPLDAVVRITADCPLLDTGLAHTALALFDGTRMVSTPPELDGLDVEVMSFRDLKAAAFNALLRSDREHVTPWIKREVGWRPVGQIRAGNRIHWSVDTPEDLAWVRCVYETCPHCRGGAPHHTNAPDSIGGHRGRTLLTDLHVGAGGGLVECLAADLLEEKKGDNRDEGTG